MCVFGQLGIRCRVNGETMQDSNTDQLVFKTEAILEWVTQVSSSGSLLWVVRACVWRE